MVLVMTVSTGIFRLSFDRGRSVHAIARVDVRHGRVRGVARARAGSRRRPHARLARRERRRESPTARRGSTPRVHLRVRSTRVSTVRRIRARGQPPPSTGSASGLRGVAPSASFLRRSRRWFSFSAGAVFESLCTRCRAVESPRRRQRRRLVQHPSSSILVPRRARGRFHQVRILFQVDAVVVLDVGFRAGERRRVVFERGRILGDNLAAPATVPDELSAREEFTSQARARATLPRAGRRGYSARRVRPRSRREALPPSPSDARDWNRSRWTSARVALPGRMGRAGSTDSRGTTASPGCLRGSGRRREGKVGGRVVADGQRGRALAAVALARAHHRRRAGSSAREVRECG